MKTLIYNWAKSFVEKQDNKSKKTKEKEEKIYLSQVETRKKFDLRIKEYQKRYIDEVSNEFKTNVGPQFSVGEIVTTNWYGPGSSWDGTVQMLQAHTPYSGPIDVEITEVVLDHCQIYDIIDNLQMRGEFDNKYTDISYDLFKKIVDNRRHDYDISWSYVIKVPGDDYEYWRYTWRENKLIKRKSDIATWSKKCYTNEVAATKLYNEKKVLDEKIRKQLERITNTKIIVR